MSDLVLVTGISGFVGGHVALQLLQAGYRVRGSVRDLRKADKVRETLGGAGADTARLEFVALDLMSDAGWADAMRDVRYLEHVASPFVATMPADKNDLIRPAVEGTTRALEAAFASPVERVIVTSSMAAVMYGHPKSRTAPFTATDWTDLDGRGVNAYTESKTRAERAAWAIAERHGRGKDLACINPGGIFGPLLDEDPGTSGQLILRLLRGDMPAAPRMSFVIVDIRDVAALHVKAITDPDAGGQRFPTGSATLSVMEISNVLAEAMPDRRRKLPRFSLPDWLVRTVGLIDSDVRGNIGELGTVKRADARSAERLLGRQFIPAGDAVAQMALSLRKFGLV